MAKKEVCRKCGRKRYGLYMLPDPTDDDKDEKCIHKFEPASDIPKGFMTWDEAEKYKGGQ